MRYDRKEMATKSTTAASSRSTAEPGTLALICVAAWLVPGAGHLILGRRQKGLVFLVTLSAMFALGLALQGRISSFDFSELLGTLAAFAQLGVGGAWIVTRMLGAGVGDVTAATSEYGSTYLIVAGLLNVLIMLDAFDIGLGRK
jgi:hypothetical protein